MIPPSPGALMLHQSNRIEALADHLGDHLHAHPLPPMVQECIVVPSRGMNRWLSLRLADRLGISAHVDFAFPAKVINRMVGALLDDGSRPELWNKAHLLWTLLAMDPAELPDDEILQARLFGDDVERILFARQLAEVIDRVVTERPEVAARWAGGGGTPEEGWLASLVAALRTRLGQPSLAELLPRISSALARPLPDHPHIPGRLTLFGTTNLPPAYLSIFTALGTQRAVNLYAPTPTQLYMGESRKPRKIEELDLDMAHPLLAAWGRPSRDFQLLMMAQADALPVHISDEALFVAPPGDTLLSRLQADILTGPEGTDPDPDPTIQLHACHGALRQVEVLRDSLLALFDDPTLDLAPSDVVILTPDPDTHAPLIAAVFDDGGATGGGHGLPRLPYALADRGLGQVSPVGDATTRILALASSRAAVSEVCTLLTLAPVRRKAGIELRELETIQTWLDAAGIRWGADAAHREAEGMPGGAANTWEFGLDRMWLGCALPTDGPQRFGGVLPYDEIEGGHTDLLGRLAVFWSHLHSSCQRLQGPHSLATWATRIPQALDLLLSPDEDEFSGMQAVRDALQQLVRDADVAGEDPLVPLAALRLLLGRAFEEGRKGSGLLTGRITLSAMVPLRNIPFKVVCMLGMDEGSFPRGGTRPGFDPVAQHPRVGDRDPRQDDLQLFLDAVLSARSHLILTWTGHNQQTNKVEPPALPVAELIAHLADRTGRAAAELIHRHPLHPFSPAAFGAGPCPPAYDPRMHRAAVATQARRVAPPPFLAGPLGPPWQELARSHAPAAQVSLDQLVDFLNSPTDHFMAHRLGIRQSRVRAPFADREPVHLDGRDRAMIGGTWVKWGLEGHSPDEIRDGLRAEGCLPVGALGEQTLAELQGETQALVTEARKHMTVKERTVGVDLDLAGTRLVGRIEGVWAPGLVMARYIRFSRHHLLGLWVRHLCLCAAASGHSTYTRSFMRTNTGVGVDAIMMRPVAAPEPILADLLELYHLGMKQPLLFFPSTSFFYAHCIVFPEDEELPPEAQDRAARTEAHDKGWRTYQPWDNAEGGEGHDPANKRVFDLADVTRPGFALPGLPNPPDLDFATLATRIWDPILANLILEGVP